MAIDITRQIDCPPDRLWPWLVEGAKIRRWMPDLVAQEPSLTDKTSADDAEKSVTKFREAGRVVSYDHEILALDTGKKLSMRLTGPVYAMVLDYDLTPQRNNSCGLRFRARFETKSLLSRLTFFFASGLNRRISLGWLARLKEVAEADQRSPQ